MSIIMNAGKKTSALIYADLDRSPINTKSRLDKKIVGKAVIVRTVRRLEKVVNLDEIIVFCPQGQYERLVELLAGTRTVVCGLKEPAGFSKRLKARKWALSSWRGGIHEATQFDEQVYTREMVDFARSREVYTVLEVPAGAVCVVPELLDELLQYHENHGHVMRFTFSQAAPGLCAVAYRIDLLHELVLAGAYIGDLFRYDPDAPHVDYIVQECNFPVEPALYKSQFRYIADTKRTFRYLDRLLSEAGKQFEQYNAAEIVAAMDKLLEEPDILPREVEIEITTSPSLRIAGYPHRQESRSWQRGNMPLVTWRKIMAQLGVYDDICLTIGGFGEPLAHPDLLNMIEIARQAGIYAINIETDGRLLKDELAERLRQSPVDVLSVFLDADSEETYRQLKGAADFDQVAGQVEAFTDKTGANGPLVVPHLVKVRETMADMESFYDRWLRKCGAAVIIGYNDFAGQIPDKAVMNMAPPRRQLCRRLGRSMTILADGRVVLCGQDFQGAYTIGDVNQQELQVVWKAPELNRVRRQQQEGLFAVNALCRDCREWFR